MVQLENSHIFQPATR